MQSTCARPIDCLAAGPGPATQAHTGTTMEAERQNLIATHLEDYADRVGQLRRYL